MSIITSESEQQASGSPTVSINSYLLSYDSTDDNLLNRRLRRPAAVAAVLLAAIAVIAASLILSVRAVGASEAEAKIKAVHFEIGRAQDEDAGPFSAQGAVNPARYRSLVVEDRGIELGLEPLAGTVRVTIDQDHLSAMAADLDGLRIGSAAPNFVDSLAEAASSADTQDFVRLSAVEGQPANLDVTYARSLRSGDYLLVQDLNGESVVNLTALNSEGVPLGTPVTVGPNYQWNTGHGVEDSLSWASVVGVHRFATGGEDVAVIRASGTNAEFKVVALRPAVSTAAEPVIANTTDGQADATEATADAASAPVPVVQVDVSAAETSTLVADQVQAQTDAGPTLADAPDVLANVVPAEAEAARPTAVAVQPTRAAIEPPTQLALTGMVTEPWVLVVFAMAFIFIGYTVYVAFRQDGRSDESRGHDQLDAFGFD